MSDPILRVYTRHPAWMAGGGEPPPCPSCGSDDVAAVVAFSRERCVAVCMACKYTLWSDDIGAGLEFAHSLRDKYCR